MPAPGQINEPGSDEQESTYEVAPAGNSVIIEEQLVNANHNSMDFSLMTNLYQKNVTMIRTALGR
jgi:flagellar basal-body rod protein FlgB